jgi:hypothetical protein
VHRVRILRGSLSVRYLVNVRQRLGEDGFGFCRRASSLLGRSRRSPATAFDHAPCGLLAQRQNPVPYVKKQEGGSERNRL